MNTLNEHTASNLAVATLVRGINCRMASPTHSSTTSYTDSAATTAKTKHIQLAADFEPSSYSVICGKCYNTKKTRQWRRPLGPVAYMQSVRSHSNLHYLSSSNHLSGRGKQNFNHVGNRRFRIIAGMFLERYSAATSKQERSTIVAEILAMVRHAGGNFCKVQGGHWWEVAKAVAREKVGALMRDCLHTQYRSSTKAKVARKKAFREQDNTLAMPQATPQTGVSVGGDGKCDDSDDSSTASSCWETTLSNGR
jgi:hypothetical protein